MTLRKESRAYAAGVRPAVEARRIAKVVAQTRAKFQRIAYDWADIYTPMDYACTHVERALDEFEQQVAEAIEFIKLPIGSDDDAP